MKFIAVSGCTLVCQFGGTAVINTPPSTDVLIDNKGVYRGPLTISVTNSSAGGASANASGAGVLNPTAAYVQADGLFVVLEGDKCDVTVAGSTSGGSATSGAEVVTIASAGQAVVLAE